MSGIVEMVEMFTPLVRCVKTYVLPADVVLMRITMVTLLLVVLPIVLVIRTSLLASSKKFLLAEL